MSKVLRHKITKSKTELKELKLYRNTKKVIKTTKSEKWQWHVIVNVLIIYLNIIIPLIRFRLSHILHVSDVFYTYN